ncbi:capsular polysaccharide biosynthesis protein [Rhodovulum euryhalinum]|uniref:Capsular polysaccharide export protein n=1 Tax=Rhodovulum euryhalinum TaxID=35805 RepID=A0A4R2KX56_9RHOB|nr:capsular polysaccharide biosynthesis protein [Rhodovulum euryhalinum]TCO71275.1 capsular polysaccharide export protein [Rhodovulum euryhalinum]
MAPERHGTAAGGETSRRLFIYNSGFLTQTRIRRILALAGYSIHLGLPGPEDLVAVWGARPTAGRGLRVAAARGAGLLRVEDAFLRSVLPGRAQGAGAPLGLLLDRRGVHFDSAAPSDLEHMLATHPLDDTALLTRARAAIGRLRMGHLTKYTGVDPDLPVPEPGYALVIDQTLGDASVTASGADAATFREMLAVAQIENPGTPVIVKTHPETAAALRPGHFTPDQAGGRVRFLADLVSPWALLEGAVAVYTVSSQMGFEAILAGHRPRVFGQPFYAGWGLTEDERPVARRERRLTRAQLAAAALILAPTWYDPFRDRLCDFEDALAALEAETRAWREDRRGWVAGGMRAWKRGTVQRFFGGVRAVRFAPDATSAEKRAKAAGRRPMVWATQATDARPGTVRVEDGFLRSRGLGAALVPPLSLVLDDLGIHYDPTRESRLERLVAAACTLDPVARARSERLIATLTRSGVTKYNLGGASLPALPPGRRILVAGQVEDDASVRLGCPGARTNSELLERTRAENPDAVILYKPHPDVEAGLRPGALDDGAARADADLVLGTAGVADLLAAVDEVWTLSSGLGFEALIRGLPVTCLGVPFYAGWGLTRDLGPVPARRAAQPDIVALAHAVLIDYPRYRDPLTGRPCPAEVVAERLAMGRLPRPGPGLRMLSRMQGALAAYAWLWR